MKTKVKVTTKSKVSTPARKVVAKKAATPLKKYQKGGKKMSESEKLMSQAKDFRKKAANTPSQNFKRDFMLSAKDLEAKAKALKVKETKAKASNSNLPSNYTPPPSRTLSADTNANYVDLQNKLNGKSKPSESKSTKSQQSEKPKTAATPAKGKTVAELWKEKTGTSWAEAKKQGLTDGSAANNMKVLKDLKAGKYDKKAPAATASPAASEKSEPVGTLPTRKATTVDNPGTKAEREKDNRASIPTFKKGGKKVMMKYKSGGVKKKSSMKKK